ncbi:PREDICTED: deleted in malignant brain tumors 1 protein-like isoform X12 [Amphimedon queenslandica]|uniref:SRCR domain-containing protein n=1 Tax=Amphimedon queenslandica TaxID=400682 RepID=A0AAN0JHX5_AMPQE|nr:PREDICTED: deleted in malignant brain tumors 1 protein-like isoform X12 [Amphimedon queenslandica]|eukprot:XP_019856574.1 PREDICTED: deleted in malignant brain tumors 1 protein-like isoform X12 [Amphimedon queenslandica]
MDDVACSSSYTKLIYCPSSILGTSNCGHSEDAGVSCQAPCTNGQIRLVGNTNVPQEGRVEYCLNNNWGTICHNSWGATDAQVACHQLGYLTEGAIAYSSAKFGSGTGPILYRNVACTGNELALSNCSKTSAGGYCSHSQDAGIRCLVNSTVNCTYGDVRLVGGSNQYEGRVEICINGIWGTVCDDYFSSTDATVVCKQLGYSYAGYGIAHSSAHFGAGSGKIWMDDVACSSSYNKLIYCPSSILGTSNCGHSEDAGVTCQAPCTNGQIRLAGNTNVPQEGRVEYCLNNNWGTICDSSWGATDAQVACYQLGYLTTGAIAYSSAKFGSGTGPVYWRYFGCSGSETTLSACSKSSGSSCSHSYDAGVRCLVNSTVNCTYGDVRLTSGSNQYEGRVEVCINGIWGTVCDDYWDSNDATVVCKQLGYGYSGNGIAYSSAHFGAGSGKIWMDDVACSSSYTKLIYCPSSILGTSNCGHSDDAGVSCQAPCTNGQIRLVGNTNVPQEGRVEYCLNNNWGTICDSSWGATDAQVACYQLGYLTTGAIAYSSAKFGSGTGPVYYRYFGCSGSETTLSACSKSSGSSCSHSYDAGVRCSVNSTVNCTYGDVRLVGGSNQYQGRVEICINGIWGTVCDDYWDSNDATVVCKQLGYSYSGYGIAYSSAHFGAGSGKIWMDDVACSSSYNKLINCPSSILGTSNCGHSDDAGVSCQAPCTDGQIRLVGNTNVPQEGRVEYCLNNNWGTICDSSWGATDAQVACYQLGYLTTGAIAYSSAKFGSGTGPVYWRYFGCSGSETTLSACSKSSGSSCSHSYDAGVRCFVNSSVNCIYGDVRLVGGSNQYQGRVEVCINGIWGTVCDDYWDSNDATVVCKQLGYSYSGNGIAYSSAHFGAGSGKIWMDDVACSSSYTKLIYCPSSILGTSNCGHSDDAGVTCQAPCTNGQIRLAGNTNVPQEGRVEYCLDNNWGTICHNSWSAVDAQVACYQLGYPTTGAVAYNSAKFDSGTGPIYYTSVGCSGSETTISACSKSSGSSCSHSQDAGVRCFVNSTVNCTYGDVRLVGGSNQYQGRVEICINGIWGTVCDDYWDSNDATVVCKQLGYSYSGNGIAYSSAHFGAGSGKIWMDDVACSSSYTKLIYCPSSILGTSNCGHSDDAGVSCQAPCTNGQLRLVGGSVAYEGRVEVCMNNEWGTVCYDYWGTPDSSVVCKQLGYSENNSVAFTNNNFGSGVGKIFMDDVQCSGNEARLIDCTYDSITSDCTHSRDAGVRCQLLPVVVTSSSTIQLQSSTQVLTSSSVTLSSQVIILSSDFSSSIVKTSASPSPSPYKSPSTSFNESPSPSPYKSPSTSFNESPSPSPYKSPSTSFNESSSPSPYKSSSPSFNESPSPSPYKSPSTSFNESPSPSPYKSPSTSFNESSSPSPYKSSSPSFNESPSPSPYKSPSTSFNESPSPYKSPSTSFNESPSPSPYKSPSPSFNESPSPSPYKSPSPSFNESPSPSPYKSPSPSFNESPSPYKSPSPSLTKPLSRFFTKSASPSFSPSTSPYKSPSPSFNESPSPSPYKSPLPSFNDTTSPSPSPSSSISPYKSSSSPNTITSSTPSPTCPSSIASISLENTMTTLLTNYSIATFTSSAQERFKQITAEIVENYCTFFKQDCNPIKLTDEMKTDGSICVVITRIQSGGSTNKRATNDQTLVTFFVTLNDGAGLLPVTALTVSVEAGIRNGNYNIFSEVVIVSGSTSSSTTTPSATLSSSSSTGTTVGVTVGVVLLVMITIGVIVIVLVFMVLRGKRENQYNTGAEVFENLVTKGSNSINSGPVFRSVLEESEKKFSNPMYGHDDD